MKKSLRIFLVISIVLQACSSDPCLKGKGDDISERRTLPSDIQTINLYNNLNLDIHIDTANYIVVGAGSNVIDFIETEISGKELVIQNKNECSFLRSFDQDISLELHIKSFNTLLYDGSRDITMFDTLNTDNFTFESNSGAGSIKLLVNASQTMQVNAIGGFIDITFFGKGKNVNIYSTGTGWIYGQNYQCEVGSVENRSTGDCLVNASNELKCTITNSGNIKYLGNPVLNVEDISGNGRVIPIK